MQVHRWAGRGWEGERRDSGQTEASTIILQRHGKSQPCLLYWNHPLIGVILLFLCVRGGVLAVVTVEAAGGTRVWSG